MIRRNTILLIPLALIALALLAGCSQGKQFDVNNISLIQKGVTTQDDIMDYFGFPHTVRQLKGAEGYFLAWDYRFVPKEGEGAELSVIFFDNGTVHSYDYTQIIEPGK